MTAHLKKIWTGPETGDPTPVIYLSGIVAGGSPEADYVKHPEIVKFQCLSYFYMDGGQNAVYTSPLSKQTRDKDIFDLFQKHGARAFLDSGAFSYQMQAIKKKQKLDRRMAEVIIDKYVDWVYACPFVFDFLATFDYSRNAEDEWWATKRIEARGLHPVPVYHLGSSITALRRLVDSGYTLIGLGGMVHKSPKLTRPFLDHVFNLTEKHGVRCHGFGVGGSVIIKYPWFSVDSTEWLQVARFGNVLRLSRDPDRFADIVTVSSRTAAIRGTEEEDTREGRIVANWQFYREFEKRYCYPTKPRTLKRRSLF